LNPHFFEKHKQNSIVMSLVKYVNRTQNVIHLNFIPVTTKL